MECIALTATVQGAEGFSSANLKIKKAVIPIYLASDTQPAAVVRVERIFPDFERRGFFRIGLLPLAVAEGVTLELPADDRWARALAEAQRKLATSAAAERVEMRHVKIVFLPESRPRLEAGRIRLNRDGQWQLLDGVSFQTATGQVQTASARLEVSSLKVGELTWRSGESANVIRLFTTNTAKPTLTATGINK